MKKLLSILLVSVILIGWGGCRITVKTDWKDGGGRIEKHYKDGKKEGLWKKWYKNGQLQYEKNSYSPIPMDSRFISIGKQAFPGCGSRDAGKLCFHMVSSNENPSEIPYSPSSIQDKH